MTQLLLIVGEPGAGKTSAMREGTQHLNRLTIPPDTFPARDALLNPKGLVGVELGAQRGVFSGTDALPMDVNPKACAYIQNPPEQPAVVLAEGARLTNRRFLQAAVDAGAQVTLLHLDNPQADTWRAARAEQLGKTQNEQWAKGRATAARNLAANPPAGVQVVTVPHPDDAAKIIRRALGQ